MCKPKQSDFFEANQELRPRRHSHGGAKSTGRRKLRRPLDKKRPLHVVLKSSKAKGALSLRCAARRTKIETLVRAQAARKGVAIHSYANVGNHLHLLVSFTERKRFQDFMRLISGLIARLVTGACRGRPFGKFWDHLAFSRVVVGHRALAYMRDYVFANQLESILGRWEREEFLKERRQSRTPIIQSKSG
ncbi:MAG: transposase [Bdellovibrionaceae bacterium]|nr:transposase [Pseudobdellovibrionaceae bacterium]